METQTQTETTKRGAEDGTAEAPGLPAWKQAVLGAAALAFVVCAVAANFRHAYVPLPQLGLFSRWEMFTNPPGGSRLVVVGTPRDAEEPSPVMVEDPADRDRPFLERLRDQRKRKLHEKLDVRAGARSGPLRRSYLDYLCRREAGRVTSVRLVLRAPTGAYGLSFLERSCERP